MTLIPRTIIFLSLFCVGAAAPSRAEIARIDLNGIIDPITSEYVVRGIARANAEHAQFVVLV